MARQHRLFAFSNLLGRLGLVLALALALNLSHFGLAAAQPAPLTMHHAHSGPDHADHHGPQGALCAMVCLGADRVERFTPPMRMDHLAIVEWTVEAPPAWAALPLDPAQRPPDMLPVA